MRLIKELIVLAQQCYTRPSYASCCTFPHNDPPESDEITYDVRDRSLWRPWVLRYISVVISFLAVMIVDSVSVRDNRTVCLLSFGKDGQSRDIRNLC